MRWLPSRAHDNGMLLLFSNGIGPDDDEIRTGNAMVLDPYGDVIASRGRWVTTWSSRISTRRCCPRHRAGAGCRRAGPNCTSR